jgi:putative PIN family toxin of toxin-antitoxin system
MRVVLDTVVFVRALINPKGRWGRLLFDVSDRYVIVSSPEIIKEILEVINRPELRRRFPEMARLPPLARVLSKLEDADVVEPRNRLSVCHDPHDDKFFECAVAGHADYIVSEDRDILDIPQYDGIKTVSAAQFLELLSSS